jgi:hypothetical protein
MHRPLILAFVLCLLAGVANAACPGNPSTCGDPMQGGTSGSVMYATAWGVEADGTTSDDVALKAALDACAAKGTKLILPPGKIRLSGAATMTVTRCHMEGTGVMAGETGNDASLGTTFLIYSATVQPFILGQNFGITGVNFYWPNQTSGTSTYPPLFVGNGTQDVAHGYIDRVVVVNAYDVFKQNLGSSWGDVYLSNSNFYAVHDIYNFSNLGDAWSFSSMRYTPGSWLNMTGNAAMAAVSAAWTAKNTMFHISDNGAGGIVNFNVVNGSSYAVAIGVKVDANATIGAGFDAMGWDGVQTVVDASAANSRLLYGTDFTGSGVTTCGEPLAFGTTTATATPCFKLGGNPLRLVGFSANGSWGNFIESTGTSVILLQDTSVQGVGFKGDAEYSILKITGTVQEVMVRGNRWVGGGPHSHGVTTNGFPPADIDIQGNHFYSFKDAINIDIASIHTTIIGNYSSGTNGPVSMVVTGSAPGIVYNGNTWDKFPLAAVSNCGAGAGITGTNSGYIAVGSTNPTTVCTLTLPFTLAGGGGGSCMFTGSTSGNSIGATVSGLDWHLAFADMHGGQIFYYCPGQN